MYGRDMLKHSTAQHSTAQHSTAQHSTAQVISALKFDVIIKNIKRYMMCGNSCHALYGVFLLYRDGVCRIKEKILNLMFSNEKI